MCFKLLHKTVILRGCDFFDWLVISHTQSDVFNLPHKTVILRACDFLSMEKTYPSHNRRVLEMFFD